MKNNIHPCIWFDGQAQAAATFYCGIFPNSTIISDNGMVVYFELNGQKFMGLNGGNQFQFNEAISFVISCENQTEIDFYWNNLVSNGGKEGQCGWCKDQFGVSWQIVPIQLGKLMSDPEKGRLVVESFMKMKKIDIESLNSL
jgi:predicted 3-demethylubiquinone-9 3-methyltransferase (glyoxalase superfamily)